MKMLLPKKTYKYISILILLLYGQVFLVSQEVFQKSGYAIDGYDVVAYFTHAKPIRGDKELSVIWRSATWLFSSEDNKKMFENGPARYSPQYGGYCAYEISQNKLIATDPTAFTITNGKLYLNYNMSTKMLWEKHREENIKKADIYWAQHIKKLRK